ncbi:SpoIIE family protein phosphatase [Streptomyces echinatus]|uniref:SpoIIE family protein phosphatase n=1 Tax=Streptomyces echinatus TaxID=67293 RepID=UPI0038247D16
MQLDQAGEPRSTESWQKPSTLVKTLRARWGQICLYTDGLIEAPGSDLDSGLGLQRRLALALAQETPLDTLCDRLSVRMPPGGTDGIALVALRLPTR